MPTVKVNDSSGSSGLPPFARASAQVGRIVPRRVSSVRPVVGSVKNAVLMAITFCCPTAGRRSRRSPDRANRSRRSHGDGRRARQRCALLPTEPRRRAEFRPRRRFPKASEAPVNARNHKAGGDLFTVLIATDAAARRTMKPAKLPGRVRASIRTVSQPLPRPPRRRCDAGTGAFEHAPSIDAGAASGADAPA